MAALRRASHWRAQVAARDRLAAGAGAPALPAAAAERGQRLGRHHAALGLRAVHQRAVVRGQAPLRAGACRSHAAPLQPPVPSVPAATCPSTTARGCCGTTRARGQTRPGPVSELRQPVVRRRRGRCVRQPAGHPVRPGRRRDGAAASSRPCRGAGVAIRIRCASCCMPITRSTRCGARYMARHQQNHPHQYHNGGIWPFVGGFWVLALALLRPARDWRAQRAGAAGARQPPRRLALHRMVPRPTRWQPMGMAGQSWNAATFLLARRAVEGGIAVF